MKLCLLTTEDSGMDFPGLSLNFVSEALCHRGWITPPPRYYAACDKSRAARSVLVSMGEDYPTHVFSDMFFRLPQQVNNECEVAAPYSKMRADDPELSSQQFLQVKLIQDAYYTSKKFNPRVRCICDRHDQLCHMYPSASETTGKLRLTIGGLECYDFSPMGSLAKMGGLSARKMYLWLAERKKFLEDLIIAECWRDFPYWILAEDWGILLILVGKPTLVR
jgi:hypothetical protein